MRAHSTRDVLLGLAIAVGCQTTALADVVPFTWDPAGAVAPLTGPGTAFTADTIMLSPVLYSVAQPDGSFTAHRIGVITGFSLNGSSIVPAGFGGDPGVAGSYGLYFEFTDTGITAPGGFPIFTSINVTLKADPGNQNLAASATPQAGVGFFGNLGPTGAADDITLATGSRITATSSFNPVTQVFSSTQLETFNPASGETGFFSSPVLDGSTSLEFVFSNPSPLITTPGLGGTTITTFGGPVTGTAQLVPEPSSMLVLGGGFLALATVLRRRQL